LSSSASSLTGASVIMGIVTVLAASSLFIH
jgi:hypothetical protein